MRASQFIAGLFAGSLAFLSVMSTVDKPFEALGEGEDAPYTTATAAETTAPPTQPPTAERYVGEFFPDMQYTYNPAASTAVPAEFTVVWRYVCMPIRDKDDPNYEPKYGYVLENVGNGSESGFNDTPLQVKYIRKYDYSETFDLRGFDPNTEPELHSWASYSGNQQALLKSVNQAIKDDFARKAAAYRYWKSLTTPTEAPTDKYPNAPSAYTVTWNSIRMPNTDKAAAGYSEEYGYVLEPGPGIGDPNNRDVVIGTKQVQYVDVMNYAETFDFRSFDPDVKPALYDVSELLKMANPHIWALHKSVNEAILNDHERKVNAFKRWRQEVEYGIYTPTTAPTYEPTEPTTSPASDLTRGDINHDGYINAVDATILLRYAAAYGTGQNPKLDDFLD